MWKSEKTHSTTMVGDVRTPQTHRKRLLSGSLFLILDFREIVHSQYAVATLVIIASNIIHYVLTIASYGIFCKCSKYDFSLTFIAFANSTKVPADTGIGNPTLTTHPSVSII